MNKENIVYVKIKNGIFKCYKSEQMHKPIYYPVESKTNGYIDYNDVEKILTIEDLYQENQKYKEVIDKLKNKTKENIENAKYEITTLTIGDKAYYQYIEKILDNYVDILKEVEDD